MPATLQTPDRPSSRGEPVWELAELFPEQGRWGERDYLKIDTNRIVELVDGCLEVPPVPDAVHQLLAFYLCLTLSELSIGGERGLAILAAFRLKIPNGNWREPDVLYLAPRNVGRARNDSWDYADLTIEIVSPDRPSRDYEDKRRDYATAEVPEYWIVDPMRTRITVLKLVGKFYVEHQTAGPGDKAESATLPGLTVDVGELFGRVRIFGQQI